MAESNAPANEETFSWIFFFLNGFEEPLIYFGSWLVATYGICNIYLWSKVGYVCCIKSSLDHLIG